MTPPAPYRVLFVCLGNICRSPAAEIIFKTMAEEQGLSSWITSDSAGMIASHHGLSPDARMIHALEKSGYRDPGLKARAVTEQDLENFDLIAGMDRENLRDLKRLDHTGQWAGKIVPMCSFVTSFSDKEVPDPYYGGQDGFEHVVQLLEEACANLLTDVKKKLGR